MPDTRTPVKSNMGFVAPEAIVKQSPSIKNLVKDVPVSELPAAAAPVSVVAAAATPQVPTEAPAPAPVRPAEPTAPEVAPVAAAQPAPVPVPEAPSTAPQATEAQPQQPAPQPVAASALPTDPAKYQEAFQQCWLQMLDIVFDKIPTLQNPLKHYPVEVKDNIVHLILRNDLQMENFSMKKITVLQYLRTNFDNKIDDVIPVIDTTSEAKKFILDEQDKLDTLRQQNPDFVDFVKTLNLRLKN